MAGYPIEVVPYDPCWPEAFEKEKSRLQNAFGSDVLRFEHMGSTAVPGLDSKPIIDISAAVADLSVVPALFEKCRELGYTPIEQKSADRYDLWKTCGKGHPSHILHFMKEGSDAWVRPIVFRNALRADAQLRTEYSELKRQLADACGDDIEKYGKGKTEFVRRVVDEILSKTA